MFVFSLPLGDDAGPVTPSAASKSKSRKETLAALAAARKEKGSVSSRKRKERNRSTQARRRGGKDWRKNVNEIAADDNTDNDRFVGYVFGGQLFYAIVVSASLPVMAKEAPVC